MKSLIVSLLIICTAAGLQAQAPGVSIPVNLEIGLGGGASLPMGTLSDAVNTGWNAGAKARISGLLPFNLVASAMYNRLPFKAGSESSTEWMIGAGVEFKLPSPVVTPYVGVDGLVNLMSSTAANAQSTTREGLGIGGGAVVSVPFLGSVDGSVKYQMFNIAGKETGEDTYSQVAVTLMLVFGVL